MIDTDILTLDGWTGASFPERRSALVAALADALGHRDEILEVAVEVGPVGREYDMTAAILTDVGRMRTPFWSQARAEIFADPSIHPANRERFGPRDEITAAAERLHRRLEVRFELESRGLTFTVANEPGVERQWTAEHSTFRRRTSVTREDRVEKAGDVDVRDLLAHFYTGPSLRMISQTGDAFLLPGASEVEGPLVTLCHACSVWSDGVHERCGSCGSDRIDVVVAARPPRR